MTKYRRRSNRNKRAMGSKNTNLHIGLCIAFALAAPEILSIGATADPLVQLAQSDELGDWNAIKDSKNAQDYQNYLDKYPNGTFAELAKRRIKQYAPPPAPAAAAPAAAAPAADPQLAEINDWNAVKNSTSPADFENFLKKYPNGNFRDLANLRL